MEDIHKMKCQIIIDTIVDGEDGLHRSKIWEGELEILDKHEYLVLVSVMAEGELHPICQIPFAKDIGHFVWIPPGMDAHIIPSGSIE